MPDDHIDWDAAACAGFSERYGYDPFHPDIIDSDGHEWLDDGTIWEAFGDTSPYYTEARDVCEGCPIRKDCLAHAMERKERWGMWGGLTPIERRRIERAARRERLKEKRARESASA